MGHQPKYRVSPLKYGALTLYLVDQQGFTGSNNDLPRLLQGLMRYITQTYGRGLRTNYAIKYSLNHGIKEAFRTQIDIAMPAHYLSLLYFRRA